MSTSYEEQCRTTRTKNRNPSKAISGCPASADSSSTRRHCCRKRRSTVGAIHVRGGQHVLALGTAGAQLMAAVRAEVEATLDEAPALGAGAADRLPQNKVENDAQSIRYQDGHERPEHGAHAAAAGVAGDVANQQQRVGKEGRGRWA